MFDSISIMMANKRQSSLTSFFAQPSVRRRVLSSENISDNEVSNSDLSMDLNSSEIAESVGTAPGSTATEEVVDMFSSQGSEQTEINGVISSMDIGLFVDKSNLDDKTKLQLCKSAWKPDETYVFIPDKRNRSFQLHWLKKYPWLEFSHVKEGAFCRPCVLFSANKKENCQLVTEPFKMNCVSIPVSIVYFHK